MPNAGDISCDFVFHAKTVFGLLGAWKRQNRKNPILRIRCFFTLFQSNEKAGFWDPEFTEFWVFAKNDKNHVFSWFLFSQNYDFRENIKIQNRILWILWFHKIDFKNFNENIISKYEINVFPINLIFSYFLNIWKNYIYPENNFIMIKFFSSNY